jgi:glycosyltransferase involved in cell wall biosynthesis
VSYFEVATLDPLGLANAIAKMIEASADARRRMGSVGRAHVADRFHPDRILDETVALYDGLLAEKGILAPRDLRAEKGIA